MKLIDISPLISEKLAVFPGDTAFSRKVSMDTLHGEHLTLSEIQTTLHLGAHADAVNHYAKSKEGIDQKNLETYFGLCQVIEVNVARGQRIFLKDFYLEDVVAPRLLFKTSSFPNPNEWNNDFNSLSPEVIWELEKKSVTLVGIDTPSVDPWDSKTLDSHQALHRTQISVLEGLVLESVAPGLYGLIAFPLKIESADASPVRAVLTDKSFFE